MNILFILQNNYLEAESTAAFQKSGENVLLRPIKEIIDFPDSLITSINKEKISFVFSINFVPFLAEVCHDRQIPYACWITDTPVPESHNDSFLYDTNYLFCFDSGLKTRWQQEGVQNCFYLPLAAGEKSVSAVPPEKRIHLNFVGSLYSETDALKKIRALSPETLGYLDGILQAQEMVYGYPFVENLLTPGILREFHQKIGLPENINHPETYYTEQFLLKILNRNERVHILKQLHSLKESLTPACYIPENTSPFGMESSGMIPDRQTLLSIYERSFMTLNITKRTTYHGIPQKVFDGMSAGSLVFSNYQPDLDAHFKNGTDYICYEDKDDLSEKIAYYLEHPEKCDKIVNRAKELVAKEHTCDARIRKLLTTLSSVCPGKEPTT